MKSSDPKWKDTAAAMVKFMVRARRRQEPDFIDERQWERWRNTPEPRNEAPIDVLLKHALKIHHRLTKDAELSSLAVEERDAPSIFELIDAFIDVQAVRAAIRAACKGRPINWPGLAQWEELQRIREGLDRLGERTRPKKVGRPGITGREAQEREDLVEEWRRAHGAGMSKGDFCSSKQIDVAQLDLALDWHAHRRKRQRGK